MQQLQVASRFRWIESSAGRITSSTHQWSPQLRARFLVDDAAKVSVNAAVGAGSHFISGWINTGAGLGPAQNDQLFLKQLFAAVRPRSDLEFQIGGLGIARGEGTEIAGYDNDGYLTGERVSYTRARGPLASISVTSGHLGDLRTPNVFRRFDRLDDWNYGQLLVGLRLHPRVSLSADYTYEDGRDILRQAMTARLPDRVPLLRSLKFEAYERFSGSDGQGFNASGDLRLTPAFTVTAGVTHIDRNYLIPGYMSPNADRHERGTRFYSLGTYALTRDWSIGWFQGHAFSTPYAIPNKHRLEAIVTFNPTASWRARRWF